MMLSRDRSASVLNVNPARRGSLGLPPCAHDHITAVSDDIRRLVLCEIAYLFVSAVGSIDLLAGWCILLRDILEHQAKSSRNWCQITRKRRKKEILRHIYTAFVVRCFNAPKYQHRTRRRRVKGLT